MFKNKTRKEIELYINDLKLYLENNYKDLAIQALKEATESVETGYREGQIKVRVYTKYQKTLEGYREQMKDYNHQQFYRS